MKFRKVISYLSLVGMSLCILPICIFCIPVTDVKTVTSVQDSVNTTEPAVTIDDTCMLLPYGHNLDDNSLQDSVITTEPAVTIEDVSMLFPYGFNLDDQTEKEKNAILNCYAGLSKNLQTIINSIVDGDCHTLASVVSFPLWCSYPERNIEDETQLALMFDILFDDSIRNVLRNYSYRNWEHVGWRGYMLMNGLFLATEEGKLFTVLYESPARLHYQEQLFIEEGRFSNADGWTAHDCFLSTDSILFLRLEKYDGAERLHVLIRDSSLRINHFVYNGTCEAQGTCHNKIYNYATGDEGVIELSDWRCGCYEANSDCYLTFPEKYGFGDYWLLELPEQFHGKTFQLQSAFWRDVKQWWGIELK